MSVTTETIVSLPETEPASPPAYFLSLTVQNLRCFGPDPQTLELLDSRKRPARWTVVFGENGTGKTTLLQQFAALQPLSDRYGEIKVWTPALFINRLIKPVSGDDILRLIEGKGRAATNAEIEFGQLITSVIPGQKQSLFGYDINRDDRFASASGTESNIGGLICYGYGASRRQSRNALTDIQKTDSCASLFDNRAELINAEEWLAQAKFSVSLAVDEQKERAEKRLSRVEKLLIGTLPDVSDFRYTVSDDKALTPRIEAKTEYGWVRISDLSLGYQTALTWMVDLAARLFDQYPDSENPLAEPCVVLVDEIDLHLHPKWQRELMERLDKTFPNAQFIVTTHSPLVAQAAPNANLALLRREGNHVVIENEVDYIRNWRVDQILTSDLFGLPSARPP